MSDARMFRGHDLDLSVADGSGGNVVATVNSAISTTLGGGMECSRIAAFRGP